jgi:hypothetical protein
MGHLRVSSIAMDIQVVWSMSRKRALTDDQCVDLAKWAESRGSFTAKAKELGISMGTLRDAILRGQGKDVGHVRRKIHDYVTRLASVPRETDEDSQIEGA